MKKYLPYIFLLIALILLQNCKRDPLFVKAQPHNPNDPDSLYQGTKYVVAIPFGFPPHLANKYSDSMTYEGVALGRRLFYDKHLSIDGQKACATCHQLGFAMGDDVQFSTNEFGVNKRNAIALQNLAWSFSFFWDGRQPTIAAAAQDAAAHELGFGLNGPVFVDSVIAYLKRDSVYVKLFKKAFGRPGTITQPEIYLGIEQFLMSAVTSNSRYDSFARGQVFFTNSENNGLSVFQQETGDCFHCHVSPAGTNLFADTSFHNNGLDSAVSIYDFADAGRGGITGNASDYGLFKTPSLRNVAISGPYMHDGRFKTLSDVLDFYSTGKKNSPTLDYFMKLPNHANGGVHLSAQNKQDLLNFLYTLTDTSYLNNPNLKSPF